MRLLILLLLCIFLTACLDRNKIPENIIIQKKMQVIMMDLLLANALNSELSIRDTSYLLITQNKSSFEQVFNIHKVSKEQFYRSYNYYLNHPDIFKTITDSLASISNRRSLELSTDTTQKKLNGNYFKDTARPAGYRQ